MIPTKPHAFDGEASCADFNQTAVEPTNGSHVHDEAHLVRGAVIGLDDELLDKE
jgi:hypothetical protein